jgi:UDP-glucose 4-epimerase
LRVVVIGGTRFVGRAIVEDLAAAGHDLLLIHRGTLEPEGMPDAVHLHTDRKDLLSHKSELDAFKPDGAIDCRALTRADAEIAIAALPADIRLVVISSVDVYRAFGALNDDRETDPVPIDEDSPVRPNRYPYKGLMEGMDDYDKLDVEDSYLPRGGTSLRLPMVYGERDYQRREEFILRRVRAGRTRIPVGAGTWLACRGYVRDLARGARLALESSTAAGEVFNLCEDRTYSIGIWSRMILDAADSKAELVRVADELLPGDLKETGTMTQHIAASAHKARAMLGWATTDPLETLRTTVAWHLANPPAGEDTDFSADDRALAGVVSQA